MKNGLLIFLIVLLGCSSSSMEDTFKKDELVIKDIFKKFDNLGDSLPYKDLHFFPNPVGEIQVDILASNSQSNAYYFDKEDMKFNRQICHFDSLSPTELTLNKLVHSENFKNFMLQVFNAGFVEGEITDNYIFLTDRKSTNWSLKHTVYKGIYFTEEEIGKIEVEKKLGDNYYLRYQMIP